MRSENFALLVGSGLMRLATVDESRERQGRVAAGASAGGLTHRLRLLAREFMRAPRGGSIRRKR
jgi:hypothetical protein